MNDMEREAIILNSAWQMIDDMVNWSIFVKNDHIQLENLMFETRQHSRLFSILLSDFLSEVRAFKGRPMPLGLNAAPSNARPSDLTFLFHIRQVCLNPKLGTEIGALRSAIEAFAQWLEGEFTAQNVNLSNIDIVADLRITRIRYLKMCGDIAKHNLVRLSTNAAHLKTLLEMAGHSVSEQQGYLALENFFDWFHNDIFIYHSSQIAEFLNNLRWSIYNYLQVEFCRSWHLTADAKPHLPIYSYRVPSEITDPAAYAMYWDVMNRSRQRPYMAQFVINGLLKHRY